jgi:uncharacterized transporter YbjL
MEKIKTVLAFLTVVIIILMAMLLIDKIRKDQKKDQKKTEHITYRPVDGYLNRVKILENNTISYVNLNTNQKNTINFYDTVWVNLDKHTVDDIDTVAMKGVIIP